MWAAVMTAMMGARGGGESTKNGRADNLEDCEKRFLGDLNRVFIGVDF